MYVGTRLQLTTYDDVIYRYLRSLESDDGGTQRGAAAHNPARYGVKGQRRRRPDNYLSFFAENHRLAEGHSWPCLSFLGVGAAA